MQGPHGFTWCARIAAQHAYGVQGRGRNEDCSSPPAQIPACAANAPGTCLGSNVIGLRGIGYPCSSDPWARRFSDMLVPALCPGHASQLTLPSTGRLPSTVSAADVTRHCSRLHRYYAAVQLLTCVHAHRSAVAFMGRSDVPPDTDEVSQVPTKGRLHVHGVFDCARLLVRKPVPRGGCCFPANCTASAPRNSTRFAAQYPARGIPLYGAFEVKHLFDSTLHFLSLGHFFCSTAPQAFFRPDRNSQRRRAQGLSRLAVAPSVRHAPRFPGHTFTAPSTAAD